jgi:shikimate kinase
MPSSGKSTLGRRLAAQLGYNFLETDDSLVSQQGKSIAQIFSDHGEAYFRELERDLLRSVQAMQSLVVSTGGGMPCFHNNIEYLLQNGLCIYLNVPIQAIFERMTSSSKNDRPLIDLSNPQKLLANLSERHLQRHPIYNKAHIVINDNFTVQNLIAKINEYQYQP